jgi:hypothetical protein
LPGVRWDADTEEEGPRVTCSRCPLLEAQYDRLLVELLEARLDVADGPLARANTVTGVLRGFIPRSRRAEVEEAIRRELGVVAAAVYERTT